GEHIRNLLLCTDPSIAKLLEASESVKNRYHHQSGLFSKLWMVQALDLIAKTDQSYRFATNKRLHLELMLLQLNEMVRASEEKKKPEAPLHGPETPLPNPPLKGEGVEKADGVQTSDNLQSPISNLQSAISPSTDSGTGQQSTISPSAGSGDSSSAGSGDSPSAGSGTEQPSSSSRRRPSLKDLVDNEKSEFVENGDEAEMKRPDREIIPVEAVEVQEHIDAYAAKISKEFPAFSSALGFKPVTVGPDNVIRIDFPNKVIAEPDHIRALKKYLREHLSESFFSIEPVIEENTSREKVILNPNERYQKITSQHPDVDDFVKKLGLEYEE
ncbi:MAG: hypothetical protein R6V49_03120, partial [Bacteroidales bacterium]